MSLLNPALYDALKRSYKKVTVVDEGVPVDYVIERVTSENGKEYTNYKIEPGGSYGERYRFNCPFCGDTKKRFYVSHLFGRVDEETGRRNYSNIHCFNDTACHSSFEYKNQLWRRVELFLVGGGIDTSSHYELDFGTEVSSELRMHVPPGKCIFLSEIDQDSPDYEAVKYVQRRGFDLNMLENYYGVRYLKYSWTYRALEGRLWTPFYRDSLLSGWTARAIPGLCSEDIKHWHSPGGLNGLLYGLNGAMQCDVCVIVEGTADKWAVGKPGLAVLSKSLGGTKMGRLGMALPHSKCKAVVVLLDPEQPEQEKEDGREHAIEVVAKRCRLLTHLPVIPVYLPLGYDPGSLSGEYLARYLYWRLDENGYTELGASLARDVRSSTAARGGH